MYLRASCPPPPSLHPPSTAPLGNLLPLSLPLPLSPSCHLFILDFLSSFHPPTPHPPIILLLSLFISILLYFMVLFFSSSSHSLFLSFPFYSPHPFSTKFSPPSLLISLSLSSALLFSSPWFSVFFSSPLQLHFLKFQMFFFTKPCCFLRTVLNSQRTHHQQPQRRFTCWKNSSLRLHFSKVFPLFLTRAGC